MLARVLAEHDAPSRVSRARRTARARAERTALCASFSGAPGPRLVHSDRLGRDRAGSVALRPCTAPNSEGQIGRGEHQTRDDVSGQNPASEVWLYLDLAGRRPPSSWSLEGYALQAPSAAVAPAP